VGADGRGGRGGGAGQHNRRDPRLGQTHAAACGHNIPALFPEHLRVGGHGVCVLAGRHGAAVALRALGLGAPRDAPRLPANILKFGSAVTSRGKQTRALTFWACLAG
jgi:hypothetical protein